MPIESGEISHDVCGTAGTTIHIPERASHLGEALWRRRAVEPHHQGQRDGNRDAVGNLEVPAAERHRQCVRQPEPGGIHRHTRQRAGQEHSIARFAVAGILHGVSKVAANQPDGLEREGGGDRLARLVGVALDSVGQSIHSRWTPSAPPEAPS